MQYSQKTLIVGGCVVVALVIMSVFVTHSFLWLSDPSYKYGQVQVGMTEAEVEMIYGPPLWTNTDPQTLIGTPVIRSSPDGVPMTIKIEKAWWYDDHHVFWLYFDEKGIVVVIEPPTISPPRSSIQRWWRFQVAPLLFESRFGESGPLVVSAVVWAGPVCACVVIWLFIRRRRMRRT